MSENKTDLKTRFLVKTKFFVSLNKGTVAETRTPSAFVDNGPFSTPESAEVFARNIATAKDIAQVTIEEAL